MKFMIFVVFSSAVVLVSGRVHVHNVRNEIDASDSDEFQNVVPVLIQDPYKVHYNNPHESEFRPQFRAIIPLARGYPQANEDLINKFASGIFAPGAHENHRTAKSNQFKILEEADDQKNMIKR